VPLHVRNCLEGGARFIIVVVVGGRKEKEKGALRDQDGGLTESAERSKAGTVPAKLTVRPGRKRRQRDSR